MQLLGSYDSEGNDLTRQRQIIENMYDPFSDTISDTYHIDRELAYEMEDYSQW
jgi:hypothetical protein